jgi:hypothetical protein
MARRNPPGPAARASVRPPPDRPAPVLRPAGPSAVMAGRPLCPGHVGRTGLRIPSERQHGVSVPSVTQSPGQPGAARTVGYRVRAATCSHDAETTPIAWRYRPEALCAAPRPDPRSWTTPGIRTAGFWPACGVRSSAATSGSPKKRTASCRLRLSISFRYQNQLIPLHLPSSTRLPIVIRWTSLGPSYTRIARTLFAMSCSGISFVTPIAPCACIDWSMISCAISVA